MYFDVCSKCGRPHDNPDYDKWEQEQEAAATITDPKGGDPC
jgi:hypothetical protein